MFITLGPECIYGTVFYFAKIKEKVWKEYGRGTVDRLG
jgi:hypothetical protein